MNDKGQREGAHRQTDSERIDSTRHGTNNTWNYPYLLHK